MRAALRCAVVLVWTALLPSIAFAQASITGTVKDTSGAVLPGVTVEAASPVLIEKAREAVTDANGRFQISICVQERTPSRLPCPDSIRSSAMAWYSAARVPHRWMPNCASGRWKRRSR